MENKHSIRDYEEILLSDEFYGISFHFCIIFGQKENMHFLQANEKMLL